MVFDFFLFYHFFISIFFIKIITTSSKGKEPARSPKPAVSLPLNPSLLGHGLRRCLKNLPTSKVSSVSYEQIRVALFFFQTMFDFFYHTRHPEIDSGSHFIFSKIFWFFFFFISSLFLFFYKNYYYFTKGKEPARSPKPAVLNLSYLQWIYLPVWLRLASTGLASTQRCKARSLCLG